MFNYRPVLLVIGIMLLILAASMLVPASLDGLLGHPDWEIFLASAFVTGFAGAAITLTTRTSSRDIDLRSAFLLTTVAWIVMPAFAALPFVFSELNLDYTDAFFEAMSGLTTTGSTVITNLHSAPPGLLIWRALLQWIGGIGIIVTAVAILPLLQIGGMQLFNIESSETSEKVLPRAAQIAGTVGVIYVCLTCFCALAVWIAGMPPFDAIAHAMTTIATGGFSTSDESIGHFNNAAIDYIVTIFMISGSVPFLLYFQVLRGRPLAFWRDSQVRLFFSIIILVILMMTAWLLQGDAVPTEKAFRYASFNVVSILTGTGYSTTDYSQWGGFAIAVFFIIMFIGGCAGSTSCGIKIFRFYLLYGAARTQINRLLRPHGIFLIHFNRRPVPESVMDSVMSFFFLFALSYIVLALLMNMLGLDLLTALSAAGTAIANVGPGLGDTIGPSGTFAEIPSPAKWLMSIGMLLGRLELFTALVLFTRTFWRG